MSKASIIREIVATGYNLRSPNTLRRYSLEALQGILQGIQMPRVPAETVAPVQTLPVTPGSEEMASYVDACTLAESVSYDMPTIAAGDEVTYVKATSVYVPTDRELYAAALGVKLPESLPTSLPVERSWERAAALLLSPWTLALKLCGIA